MVRPLALVTGASSGIGAEVARLLAARGWRTLLLARRADRLRDLAAELSPRAASTAVPLDLADAAAVPAAVQVLLQEHGPVQLLVNNAGGGICEPFLNHSLADHRRLMELNYLSAVALTHALLPGMLATGRGQIINVASIASKVGPWGHSGYAAAKAALVSLTQSLAAEYAGRGVHFCYVNPGIVDTEFFQHPTYHKLAATLRRHAIPTQRVARAIVGLLDHPRLELCVPRHYRLLDWIKALSPRLAQRLVAHSSRPEGG